MGKNHSMSRVERSRREKVTRYSVRKVSFGAASVAVAAFFMFLGNGAVYAAEPNVTATDPALAATPANNQLDENSGASDSTAPKAQADTTTPTPADATPAPVVSSTTSAIEEKSAEKNTEASSAEANSVENKQQTTVKAEEPSTTSVATTKPAEETATTESSKPKVRKRRAAAPASPATAADADTDANQVFEAPEDGASVDYLAAKLKALPETVENEKKLANIDQVGATKSINPGEVSELDEFGGWKAVNGGKFGVARKTDNGVFSIETVNTVRTQNGKDKTWLNESSFERSKNYALFLGLVRTKATEQEEVDDRSKYTQEGDYSNKGKGVTKYKGIEKTFKNYSPETGSDVTVSFYTGITGDIDGNKAGYKVEVIAKTDEGNETIIYNQSFYPQNEISDENKIVKKLNLGGDAVLETIRSQTEDKKNELTKKLGEDSNKRRLGTSHGTFTSKNISLASGVTEYTVRISAADNKKLGMGFQVPWRQYALPVVGTGFRVTQDTRKVAKDLAKKVYDELARQKEKDTKWSTPETKADYEEKLNKIKENLDITSTTANYKTVVEEALEKRKQLDEEQQIKNKAKEAVDAALAEKAKAIEANDKLTDAEKTAAKEEAKKAADEAKKAIEAATDQAGVDAKATEGTKAVEAVNPVGKEKAKAAVEAELAKKLAELENATDLTEAEKAAAKAQVVNKAKEAIEAIQKAATEADIDQAIRNFVYRISAVIREQEEYDLSKLFVNGSVTVKQGESLTDKDVLSKLNLPSGVEIVKVEKPTTSALGRLVAKVTLKLSDGSVEEINVPVEVVAPQNHGNEGNGGNNGATNTDAKVDKAKLEGAIHQLDELLLKESAKLDAETAKEANALSADAKKVFANAEATQAAVDAMVKRIEDFMAKVAPSTDHATPANDQAAQKPAAAPVTTQAAANAGQTASAQVNARKVAKELPNTGTADSTVAMVAAAASALLGLGLAGRRRKEDEEA